jgi:hypothetical protein
LKELAAGDQSQQFRAALARRIQLKIVEDDDEDDEDDDDEDEDDDEDDDDRDNDSISELREQVELLRREVHELHELVERVISRK